MGNVSAPMIPSAQEIERAPKHTEVLLGPKATLLSQRDLSERGGVYPGDLVIAAGPPARRG